MSLPTRRGGGSPNRDVAFHELAAPAASFDALRNVADEAAHGQVSTPQLMDDVAAHEAAATGDQNHPAGSL